LTGPGNLFLQRASRGNCRRATEAAWTLSQGQWALVTFLSMLTRYCSASRVLGYMLTKRRSG